MTQDPKSNSNSYPSREAIEQRARDIWEQRGRPEGQELDHWYQAEKELLEMRNTAEKRGGTNPPKSSPATAAAKPNPAPAAKPTPASAAAPKAPVPAASAPKPTAAAQPVSPAPKVDPKKSAAPLPPKKK